MVVLDEKTRVNLQINNVWAIVVSLVIFGFSAAMLYTRLVKIETKIDSIATNIVDIKSTDEKQTGSLNDLWFNLTAFASKLEIDIIRTVKNN